MTFSPVVLRNFQARLPAAPSDVCWRWMGARNRDGYGTLGDRYAHRIAFELAHGLVPNGCEVDHRCFVRDCVNPAHLRALPVLVNRSEQRSASKTHCLNGHQFDERNTYRRLTNGRRDCRPCIAARQRASSLGAGRIIAAASAGSRMAVVNEAGKLGYLAGRRLRQTEAER